MLPAFPDFKQPLIKWTVRILKEECKRLAPVVHLFPRSQQHEGHRHIFIREDGTMVEMNYKERSAELSIPFSEMQKVGYNEIESKMKVMAQDIASQLSKDVYKTLDEAVKESGNISRGPLSADSILDGLDKMLWGFDENGNPQWPTLVCHPDAHDKLQEAIKTVESDPKHKKRLELIINKKRQEWYDRESCRELVD